MDFMNPYYLTDPEAPDPYKDLDENQRVSVAIIQGVLYFIGMLVAILFMGLLSGCTVPRAVEEHHHHHYETDTAAVNRQIDGRLTQWHSETEAFVREKLEQFSKQQQQSEQQHETITETVTVERVRTDTLRITQLQRDSIWLHDSIHVKELVKGDTVWMNVERWHTQYRDRWRTDTVYQSRSDSIPVPYPVEKRVPAELSTWQRIRLWLGNIMLIALGLAGLWYSRRWWR